MVRLCYGLLGGPKMVKYGITSGPADKPKVTPRMALPCSELDL